jgi:hypothetical protein
VTRRADRAKRAGGLTVARAKDRRVQKLGSLGVIEMRMSQHHSLDAVVNRPPHRAEV